MAITISELNYQYSELNDIMMKMFLIKMYIQTYLMLIVR